MEDALEELVGKYTMKYDRRGRSRHNGDFRKPLRGFRRHGNRRTLFRVRPRRRAGNQIRERQGFVYSLCEGLPAEGQVVRYDSFAERLGDDEKQTVKYTLEFTVKRLKTAGLGRSNYISRRRMNKPPFHNNMYI